MIHDEVGKHAVSADDQFLYAHDYARLYVVISIATSESLQFLFPEATTYGNYTAFCYGVALYRIICTCTESSPEGGLVVTEPPNHGT